MNEKTAKNVDEPEVAWDDFSAPETRKSFIFNSVEFAFRYCPPGTFPMGTPENERDAWDRRATPRQATLTRGFWLAEATTTRAQFQATNAKPKRLQSGLDLPVADATWFDAVEFCESLNALNVASPGFAFRPPASAEWERACRVWTRLLGAGCRPDGPGTGTQTAPKPASKRESQPDWLQRLTESSASDAAAVANSALGRASPVGKTKALRSARAVSASRWAARIDRANRRRRRNLASTLKTAGELFD